MVSNKQPNLRISIQTVTPVEARIYLDQHDNYRSISRNRVTAYTRIMKEGKWGLSILIFDTAGILVDGQTRLQAVIDSGRAQEFAVVTGWPLSDIVNLDNNQARTKGQTVKAELGIKKGSHAASYAVGIEHLFTKDYLTNMEVKDLVEKYRSIIQKVIAVQGSSQIQAVMHGMPYVRALRKYPEHEEAILEALRKLKDLDFGEYRAEGLKQYYLRCVAGNVSATTKDARTEIYMKGARALEAYLKNEHLTVLKAPKVDPFEMGGD